MRFRLQIERNFIRNYKKLNIRERNQVDEKIRILGKNPWHPSLRTKRIQGTREYEVSVNMDIRMAITFVEDRLIIILDIGHHDRLLKARTR